MKKTIAIGALILGFLMPHTVLAQNKAEQTADELQTSVSADISVAEDTLDEAEASGSLYDENDEDFSEDDLHDWMKTSTYDIIDDVIDAMIPISICVILPLAIVFMVFYFRRKREQERARLIEKMIEKDMDVSAFIKAEKAGADDNEGGSNTTTNFIKMLAWGLVLLFGGICIVIYQISNNEYNYGGNITIMGWIASGIGLALTITALVWRHAIRKDASQAVKQD
jgi:heme/copper-type cytochrome/quinol oxidase subunit 2